MNETRWVNWIKDRSRWTRSLQGLFKAFTFISKKSLHHSFFPHFHDHPTRHPQHLSDKQRPVKTVPSEPKPISQPIMLRHKKKHSFPLKQFTRLLTSCFNVKHHVLSSISRYPFGPILVSIITHLIVHPSFQAKQFKVSRWVPMNTK